jgi:hypothetical protein
MHEQPCSDIIDVKVFVARIDERLKGIDVKLDKALNKVDEHDDAIKKYKHDRNIVVGIFSALFTAAIAVFRTGK